MSTLGVRIKQARTAAGLRQADLAEKLNVAIRTVQAWEQGENEPRIHRIHDIAEVTGQPVTAIMGAEPRGQVDLEELIAALPEQVADAIRAAGGDPATSLTESLPPYPGIEALLADEEMCKELRITRAERRALRVGIAWPQGPENKAQAIQVLQAMRSCTADRAKRPD